MGVRSGDFPDDRFAMILAIICPLNICAEQRGWIEGVRARHDPQHDMVEAHFTLVFPTDKVSLVGSSEHAEEIARGMSPISFRLADVRAVRDHDAHRSLVFLIPDQGDSEIRALHDALYEGEFKSSLRTDIPYLPHVTVASFAEHYVAEELCEAIGRIEILGTLPALDVVSGNDRRVCVERSIALGVANHDR